MATIKKAYIDSIRLSGSAYQLFNNHKAFTVTTLKDDSTLNYNLFLKLTGKPPSQYLKRAYMVTHIDTNQSFLIDHYASMTHDTTVTTRSKEPYFNIHFSGLKGYSDKSNNLLDILTILTNELIYYLITRIDACLDFERLPSSLMQNIGMDKNLKSNTYKNTLYLNSSTLNIAIYDKALKAKLDKDLTRVEFRFNRSWLLSATTVSHYEKDSLKGLYKRIESYIEKRFNYKLKIQKLPSQKFP